jgi:hydroxybutyrate-dimer hydrolase
MLCLAQATLYQSTMACRARRPEHPGMPISRIASVLASLALAACATVPAPNESESMRLSDIRVTEHREGDDLLSAGLGLEGLRRAAPPAPEDAESPNAAELRRRAIWANWRGIADLTPGGGFGEVFGSMPRVPGREFHALAWLPGARQPHRVLLQLPDDFDASQRCLVVTASSGSRGIYGAISLAGGWGLPRGCAVAYTDKGTGTGFFDLAAGVGAGLSGVPGEGAPEFAPTVDASPVPLVATKHAHSGDNPEADWGRHLKQAAEFALAQLSEALPAQAPFTFENTRIIAAGLSNGGAAVLRAAADEDPWLDAAVALEPNVHVADGGRPAFDYGSEAALLMPCALLDARFDATPFARDAEGKPPALWAQACEVAHRRGMLDAGHLRAQIDEALARLHAAGWTDEAMAAGALSVSLDMWRNVGAIYASAYLRRGPADMPCGYRVGVVDAAGELRAASAAERALWWSDGNGIPPTAGVSLISPVEDDVPPPLAGLHCLRALWTADSEDARALKAAIEATRAGPPRAGLPLIVAHGLEDGLIREQFSSAAYVRMAQAAGRPLRYWPLPHVQHFDAFIGLPVWSSRYLPMLAYGYRALDIVSDELERGMVGEPGVRQPRSRPRAAADGAVEALTPAHLDLPQR